MNDPVLVDEAEEARRGAAAEGRKVEDHAAARALETELEGDRVRPKSAERGVVSELLREIIEFPRAVGPTLHACGFFHKVHLELETEIRLGWLGECGAHCGDSH